VGLASHEAIKRPSKGAQNHGFWGHFGHGKGLRDGFLRPQGLKIDEVQNK